MMDLKEYCYSLGKMDLLKTAIRACEKTMIIWDTYTENNKLEYWDFVVGLHHKVRKQLLKDAIQHCGESRYQVFLKRRRLELIEEFRDPIVSLQDNDWELPHPVQQTFYSVYNLLAGLNEEKTIFNELTHYVAINQAVDAMAGSGLFTTEEIKKVVYEN